MSNFGFLSGVDDSEVENLLSQAKDLYVLEQVAAINCSGFTDSALPTNLETRFRRLKSLPVSRKPDPVSSSEKLLSHSKSMASRPEKNRRNASSASAFSGDEKRTLSGIKLDLSVKSRPLDSSETRVFSGIKRDPSVNSGSDGRDFTGSARFGSISSRFSLEGKKLPKEKSRISSSSFTSIDLASPSSSSDLDPKSKSKSKLSTSWFDKLSPSRAMGCLWRSPSESSTNSKNTMKKSNKSSDSGGLSSEEKLKQAMDSIKESQRLRRKAEKLVKKCKALRGPFWFLVC